MKLFKFNVNKTFSLPIDLYAKNKKEALQMLNDLIVCSDMNFLFNNYVKEEKIIIKKIY